LCELEFFFSVPKAPTIDAAPAVELLQTGHFATASGTALTLTDPIAPRFGGGLGTSISTILLAAPEINTVATPAATLPQPISDTATVTGPLAAPLPTGTVTFTLFDNPTCTGTPVFTSPDRPLLPGAPGGTNDATASSTAFTPTLPGSYNWVAVYSGDANYVSVTAPCGAPNETSVVTRPVATINTVATPNVPIGSPISDIANVTGPAGSPAPTGTVTFTLFSNATCTGPAVFTSPDRPIVGGTATSLPFTPPLPGQYNWVATYNGDALYAPVTAPCGAPNEQSVVNPAEPAITTEATPAVPLGQPISDVATLSGGNQPTGTITFNLYAPADVTCAGPALFTSVVPVAGNGVYTSGSFAPDQPGTYRWRARYNGDLRNIAATHPCGEPIENSRVVGPPVIRVVKDVTPATRLEPGGNFTFSVTVTNIGPNQLTITSLTDVIEGVAAPVNLNGQGNCILGAVLAADPDGLGPLVGGSYSCTFTREFLGIGGASQDDVVTVIGVDELGQQATDDDDATINITDVVPNIQVVKDATPESLPEPGGTFTFTVTVTNTSIEPLTITSLEDDVYENIDTLGTCTDAIGTVLAPSGGTYTCEFPGDFEGSAGDQQIDTVTVIAVDDEGTEATDSDTATVTLTGVAPTVQVVKTASPETRPAPGGTFTFTVVVTNTSSEDVTITTLTDDIYGDISTQGTCTNAIGTVLAPAATYSCAFDGNFAGPGSQVDVVTVIVTDDDDQTATDTDDATVTVTPLPPAEVIQQNLVAPPENPTTPTPTSSTTRTQTQSALPKTGAGVTDMAALAAGLMALGTLLLLAGSRWGQGAPLVAAAGATRVRAAWSRHRTT
jgi:uncharacterized repeat protein (TIGR01451 family)